MLYLLRYGYASLPEHPILVLAHDADRRVESPLIMHWICVQDTVYA